MENHLEGVFCVSVMDQPVHVGVVRSTSFEEFGIRLFVNGRPAGIELGFVAFHEALQLFLWPGCAVVIAACVDKDFFGNDDGLRCLLCVAPCI